MRLATEFKIETLFITSTSHYSPNTEEQYIIVDNISQAADIAIINNLKANDIVVTQDFGLASLVLSKKGLAISTRGMVYRNENIDELIYQRHLSAEIRRQGGKTKGPTKLKQVDRERFKQNLQKLIMEALNYTSSPE